MCIWQQWFALLYIILYKWDEAAKPIGVPCIPYGIFIAHRKGPLPVTIPFECH